MESIRISRIRGGIPRAKASPQGSGGSAKFFTAMNDDLQPMDGLRRRWPFDGSKWDDYFAMEGSKEVRVVKKNRLIDRSINFDGSNNESDGPKKVADKDPAAFWGRKTHRARRLHDE